MTERITSQKNQDGTTTLWKFNEAEQQATHVTPEGKTKLTKNWVVSGSVRTIIK